MEQLLIEFNKLSLEVCFYIMHFLKQYSNIVKELVHALAVRILSYGYIWEVWRALKKLQLLSAAPQATLKLLPCSPNSPHASIIQYTHAKHLPILLIFFFNCFTVKLHLPEIEINSPRMEGFRPFSFSPFFYLQTPYICPRVRTSLPISLPS